MIALTFLPEDEVVVASTDYDWRQYEVKVIVPCHDCQANQIRVFGQFTNTHGRDFK